MFYYFFIYFFFRLTLHQSSQQEEQCCLPCRAHGQASGHPVSATPDAEAEVFLARIILLIFALL
jgi:hypothetical protein